MVRKQFAVVVLWIAGLGLGGEAKAQFGFNPGYPPVCAGPGSVFDAPMPFTDTNGMAADMVRRNQAWNEECWRQSLILGGIGARMGQTARLNMGQFQTSMAGARSAFDGLNQSIAHGQDVRGNAVNTFGNTVLGNWTYGNPGAGVPPMVMPYGPPTYTVPPTELGQPFPAAVPGTYYPPVSGVPLYPTPVFGQ